MPKRATRTSFKKGNNLSKGKRKSRKASALRKNEFALETNKKGKVAFDREEREAFVMSVEVVKRYININMGLGHAELMRKYRDPKLRAFEKIIIKMILMAGNQFTGALGAVQLADFLLDRLIGKVTTKIEHTMKTKYEGKTLEELHAMRDKLVIDNEKTLRLLENPPEHLRFREVTEIAIVEDPKPEPTTNAEHTGIPGETKGDNRTA